MANIVFIEVYDTKEDYEKEKQLRMSLQSLVTYCVYKYCSPELVHLKMVSNTDIKLKNDVTVKLYGENLEILQNTEVPWQVASCVYPVVMYKDTIITGLCAVARHICKYKMHSQNMYEHEEGLLGFRKSCLQAPNEVSIWTKFCEVDLIKSVQMLLEMSDLEEVPENLVRYENHLKKPVRVHNVYKIARDKKMENNKPKQVCEEEKNPKVCTEYMQQASVNSRVPKTRKWKSNKTKDLLVECSTKIEDLDISHQFAEGPFLTLADLVLLPLYYISIQLFGETKFKCFLPMSQKWYDNIILITEMQPIFLFLSNLKLKPLPMANVIQPMMEDVSLYKCDPKRHNPKKRIFTKEDDIEKALCSVSDNMELTTSINDFKSELDWNDIPSGANPLAGHLPDERMTRKSHQLKNLTLAVLEIAKDGDLIVDFCSGSGHLGILIAYLLPKCTVILLENKEQSLLRARLRVHEMGLKNVYFFQCNLDFFNGKFDIGIALHACGIASDLVLDKCLKANAKFVLCPCCYGSLHATDRLVYPRSSKFSSVPIDQYLCIGHAADQTHKEHPLAVRGARCMAIIDSDRGRLAEEFGYKVTLSKLKPFNCTPKNNLLIGIPS